MENPLHHIRPKVSAIISAYFCEEYLDPRIWNLLGQTLCPEIVVVVKSGSKEHEIAERCFRMAQHQKNTPGKWAYQLEGFQIVETKDIPTIYKAWNLGIKAAKGEYITNANSDDLLAEYGIFKLAHELDKRPEVGLVYADVDIVHTLTGGFDSAWREGFFRWAEGGHQELLQQCFVGPMPMWRRSLHEKHGYFDMEFRSAGDYEFWLRLSKAGVQFHHLREVLGIYLRREDQAEQRFGREGIAAKETIEARKRHDRPG